MMNPLLLAFFVVTALGCEVGTPTERVPDEDSPDLFGAFSTDCEAQDKKSAAIKMLELAEEHQERYMFKRYAGIQAVGYYSQAAQCFKSVGLSDEYRRSTTLAANLALRIENDFKESWLRADVMMRDGKQEEAIDALRETLLFVENSRSAHFAQSLVRALNELESAMVTVEN